MDNFDLRKFISEQKEAQRIDELNVTQLSKILNLELPAARKIKDDIYDEMWHFWDTNRPPADQPRPVDLVYYLNRILSTVGYNIEREKSSICSK